MAAKKGAVPKLRTEQPFRRSPRTARTPPSTPKPTPTSKVITTVTSTKGNNSVYLCQICGNEDDVQKIHCDGCSLWYHFTCAKINREVMLQDSWLCDTCKAKKVTTPSSELVNIEAEKLSKQLAPSPPVVSGTTKDQPVVEAANPSSTASSVSQQTTLTQTPDNNLVNSETNNPPVKSDSNNETNKLPVQSDSNLLETNNPPVQSDSKPVPVNSARSRKAKSTTSSMSRRATLALQRLEEERELRERRDARMLNETRRLQAERDEEYLRQKYVILEDDASSSHSFDGKDFNLEKAESIRRWAESIQSIRFYDAVSRMCSTNINEIPATVDNPNPAELQNMTQNGTDTNDGAVGVTQVDVTVVSKEIVAPSNGQADKLPRWLTNPDPTDSNKVELDATNTVATNVTTSAKQNTAGALGIYDFPPLPTSTSQNVTGAQGNYNFPSLSTAASQKVTDIQGNYNFPPLPLSIAPTSSYQTIGSGQQTANGPAQLLNGFDQWSQVNTTFSQPLNTILTPTTGQPMLIAVTHPMSIGTLQQLDIINQSAPTNAIQQQPIATYTATGLHPLQPVMSVQAKPFSQPPYSSQVTFMGTSHPQLLGASLMQQSYNNQTSPFVASQPQLLGASQPQLLGSQPQWLIASQPQLLGASQPQQTVIGQTSFLGANQPLLTGRIQNPNTNQLFNASQSNSMAQQFAHGQPSLSVSSTYQHQPISNSYVPISQQLHTSHTIGVTSGLNQSHAIGHIPSLNQSAVAIGITPTRLTAEQIAARHVVKDLPHFYGDPRDWGIFISAYDNANETCGFTNSENLDRLRRSLKGEAQNNVKCLLLHKDSVPKIIDTLRLLYGMPENIVEAAIQDAERISPPREDDLRSLIKFAKSVQNLSATIKSTGALEHLRNPNLMKSIIGKLPTQHQLNWAFYQMTVVEANISHLGDWLYKIAEVASRVVHTVNKQTKKNDTVDQNKKKPESNNSFINSQMESNSSNKSNSKDSKRDSNRTCPACCSNKCNKLEDCKKFKEADRDARWTIIKQGQRCGRCFGSHKYYRCQSDQRCSVNGCGMNHHTMLHKYQQIPETIATDNKSKDTSDSDTATCNSQRSSANQRTDIFRIVPIILYNKGKKIRDYAYLDEGSNMTTMEDSLANELELTGSSKELCVEWALGKTHTVGDSRIVTTKISGYFEKAPQFNITNIQTVKHLHLPTQSVTNNWLERYPHFKNVPITTYEAAKPRILIGLQYSKLITSLETIEGNDNEPIVCRTRLGWVVQGPTYEMDGKESGQTFSVNMCLCQPNDNDNELHQLVKEYFTIEHLGIKIPENNLESKDLQRARKILEDTTIKKANRYETGLLWKHDKIDLPDSYNMALKRLVCLEAKMEKSPALKENLHNQIKQFVEKGYIRKLSAEEIQNCKHPVWYLPTFPVFNPKKPEKVRLVWDGAAKVKNTSLNSNLLVGPDELVPLPELLRRFRERKIAITGDIEEMYHQIQVCEADQHVQRFLWREDPSKEPEIYVMMVMTFGSKCSPSTAQYIKNRNAKDFQDKYPRAVDAIINNHYVDDMIESTDTVNDAETLVKDVKTIHTAGGFNIRNFTSNSKKLLERIGESAVRANKDLNMGIELGKERVLGMFWNTATDTFTYSLKFTKINQKMLSGEYSPTKREVLRILMSVFDPLGLIANFLVYGKILLQEIWRSKIDWDERLTETLQMKWINWIHALQNVEKLQIPRWYSAKLVPHTPKSIQLHTFVDASVEACAATSYLRIENEDGIECCLVGAKTKVAPTKQLTVPRLELQAAVIGTRLAENICRSQTLVIEKRVYWTDSQTVMAWINSESRRYNQFVSFRIGEILEVTDPIQWRWVPTKHNVADEATKSKVIPKLFANSRWFKAPTFLYESEKNWPIQHKNFATEEELRPSFVMSMRVIHLEQLIDLSRFSNWSRLLRTQAYVLRFIHNVKVAKQNRLIGLLSQEEIIRAESQLYQRAQRDVFLDEILVLKHNENAIKDDEKEFERSSDLRDLSPYLDEHNVLRMKGRLDAAKSISYDTKRPVILPRRHRVTHLLVDWYHRRYKHINHQTALNEIRQKYVIPALRVVMKGIRTSCQRCKNASAKPRIPEMAGLPSARLATYTRPFTFTGVDYFGPFRVKVNRSVVPKYGVLFTCLTTRAIHLEVADSLNTNSCINAIIRFSTQKGMCREFFSDNGTNFHGTDNELQKEFEKLDKNEIQQRFTSAEQKWSFNPPTASHMGGAWERLIQTVKNCLMQMLTTKTPNHEMLVTLMAEVENIVNSRPLTYISLDSEDDEALTPNHFLFGSSNAMLPIGETTRRDLTRNDWRALQEMTKHFWHRFVLEYMPDLTKRTKWFKKTEPIKVGDIVLNIDEHNPRNIWPKGIVEEVIIAKDGNIRQVVVKFEKNILKRPVSKLAILDVTPPNKEEQSKLKPMGSAYEGSYVVQRSNDVNTDSSEKDSARVLPYMLSNETIGTVGNLRYSLRKKKSSEQVRHC